MTDLGYDPLTFFWIAIYTDGTALPQFDPETGKENPFSAVDMSKLKSIGWYPFTLQLAEVIAQDINIRKLPYYVAEMKEGREAVIYRSPTLSYMVKDPTVKMRTTTYVLGYEEEGRKFVISIDDKGCVTLGGSDAG